MSSESESEKSYRVTVYAVDGIKTKWNAPKEPGCKELQRLVGGYLELFKSNTTKKGEDVYYCDEEGILKGTERNPFFPNILGSVVRVRALP